MNLLALPGRQSLPMHEAVGNAFGLASALGGMRRKVCAWPVGIVGNLLLLTVFLGSALSSEQSLPHLLGQAGRQVMSIAVAIYGWLRWGAHGGRVTPRWSPAGAHIDLAAGMVVATVALIPLFQALGSWEPMWADTWTFAVSLLATYGMPRGWTEFWLIGIAVDKVGVTLLFGSGYCSIGLMYVFYGAFATVGFVVWCRTHAASAPVEIIPPDPNPRRKENHRAPGRVPQTEHCSVWWDRPQTMPPEGPRSRPTRKQ